MKTVFKRIAISFLSAITFFSLCLLVLPGCDENQKELEYSVTIVAPDNDTTFADGDSIPFEMKFEVYSRLRTVPIRKGTIIQWTSDIAGDFWKEEIDHDILSDNKDNTASYSQNFSTSFLPAGNHTITCSVYRVYSPLIIDYAKASLAVHITESQTSSTTTIAATSDRFKDNGDGTVTDTATGLVWLKNANPCRPGKTWADAGTYCSSLKSGMAGLTDGSTPGQWRLPSVQELEGIGTDPPTTYCIDDTSCTEMVCPVPWTKPKAPFTNNPDDPIYWSDASYIGNPDYYAWTVFMYNGYVDFDLKSYSRSTVWPVRGSN